MKETGGPDTIDVCSCESLAIMVGRAARRRGQGRVGGLQSGGSASEGQSHNARRVQRMRRVVVSVCGVSSPPAFFFFCLQPNKSNGG